MPSSPVGARWTGHPLLNVFSGQRTLSAYVRFLIWNSKALPKPRFDPIPANIEISLMHAGSSDTLIDKQKTDANGVAAFAIPQMSPEHPNMFFTVATSAIPAGFAGHPVIPPSWSTKGWKSRDGKEAGYNPGFKPKTFGTAAKPIEFEVGLSLVIRIEYELVSEDNRYVALLPTTKVKVTDGTLDLIATLDDRAILSLFTFDIKAGSSLSLHLIATVDSGPDEQHPNLRGVYVGNWLGPQDLAGIPAPGPPLSFDISFLQSHLVNIDRTSYGYDNPALPFPITISKSQNYELCGAFTCLKNLAEVNALIHYTVPSSDWDDFSGCHINLGLLGSAISWPPEVISLSNTALKKRPTHIHEASHQFFWAFAGLTAAEIALLGVGPDLEMSHAWWRLLGPTTAMIEGWAAIFQYLSRFNEVKLVKYVKYAYIEAKVSGTINSFSITDEDDVDIELSRLNFANWGEYVEGVFAAGIFTLFRDYVIKPWLPPGGIPLLPPQPDADVTRHPHLIWLVDTSSDAQAARDKFYNVFVAPAKGMTSIASPTTTDFIDNLKASVGKDWDLVRGILQNFNMASAELIAVQITNKPSANGTLNEFGRQTQPSSIPAAGGSVEIFGLHLGQAPETEITIGTDQVAFTWNGPNHLSCIAPPNPPGTVATVAVFSPDGDYFLPAALLYV